MIHRAMHRLDGLLMGRVFQPIAHWADYRWHVNHFRLALFCIQLGFASFIVGSFAAWLPSHTLFGAISPAIAVASVWFSRSWIPQLTEASAAFERDPAAIPYAARGFVFMLPCARALMASLSISLAAIMTGPIILIGSAGLAVQELYIPLMVCMFYFAGVVPSGRARKPKKERAPVGLEPAPAR